MSDPAYISHIVSQTRANVDFLQAQGYLTVEDAASIRSKLANSSLKTYGNLSVNIPVSTSQSRNPIPTYQSNYPRPPQLPQLTPSYPRARALWAYNEDGRVRRFAEVVQHPAAHV
jgi:LAS seventeen-binding protein 1/2